MYREYNMIQGRFYVIKFYNKYNLYLSYQNSFKLSTIYVQAYPCIYKFHFGD